MWTVRVSGTSLLGSLPAPPLTSRRAGAGPVAFWRRGEVALSRGLTFLHLWTRTSLRARRRGGPFPALYKGAALSGSSGTDRSAGGSAWRRGRGAHTPLALRQEAAPRRTRPGLWNSCRARSRLPRRRPRQPRAPPRVARAAGPGAQTGRPPSPARPGRFKVTALLARVTPEPISPGDQKSLEMEPSPGPGLGKVT